MVDRSGSGIPITWEDGKIRWMADGGDLSEKISNDVAVGWVNELLNAWGNATLETVNGDAVDVVDLEIEYGGTFSADINVDNYEDYYEVADGSAVIIFDEDGAIIDDQLGDGAKEFVIGFASPVTRGGSDYFIGGVVVLNGLFIDNEVEVVGGVSDEAYRAAIFHELGHLLNLDHTQANIEAVKRIEDGDKSLSDEIPTMYTVLYTKDQLSLHVDDVVALAEQYPSKEYLDNFCRISGELLDDNRTGLQGADVVARAVDPVYEWSDVRTIVSGVLYPKNANNGSYVIGGFVPGRKYSLGYRGIDPLFSGGASIAPYDPPKAGIVGGNIYKSTLMCGGGGESFDINETTVAIDPNLASTSETDSSKSRDSSGTTPSGGCSLIRQP